MRQEACLLQASTVMRNHRPFLINAGVFFSSFPAWRLPRKYLNICKDEEILSTPPHGCRLLPYCRDYIGLCPKLASKDGSNG